MRVRKKTAKEIVVSSRQVIDRSKWVFGDNRESLGFTKMLNEKGNMCCLGQICANSGFGEDLMIDAVYPSSVMQRSDFTNIPWLVKKTGGMTRLSLSAACYNDDSELSLQQREEHLIKLFAKHGMTIEFKGKYPDGVK